MQHNATPNNNDVVSFYFFGLCNENPYDVYLFNDDLWHESLLHDVVNYALFSTNEC